tara:strand:- start:3858 stop:5105 length:1248 start_codon:yes stop_codon:yes gene_type:complete
MTGAATPLKGTRIIDFTMGWAGPLASRQLADLGAEVIKIEGGKHPDWWRGFETSAESMARGDHERTPAFNHMNRNKLGVAIDLARPEGRALALELVKRADAAIENQATGVMQKLGLSYDNLKAVNPGIVMVSLPGFGAEGPWAGYRGYGSTFEQASGLPQLTGRADDPPVQTHIAYGDACGGLFSAAALLTALYHKRRTGEGQRVELSQVETMMQLGAHGFVEHGLTGRAPERRGNRHPLFVPQGCFACDGNDRWIVISVTDDTMWTRLARIIGRNDLGQDPTLATVEGRRPREAEIERAIAAWTAQRTQTDAMETLQSAGVAAGQVARPLQLLDDPVLTARDFWQVVDRAYVGPRPHPSMPYRLNGERGQIRAPAPLLGQHTEHVLRDVLGMGDDDIARLMADGIVARAPDPME